ASTNWTSATGRAPLDPVDRGAELRPRAALSLAPGAELVEREQRRADDVRRAGRAHLDPRADVPEALLDGVEQPAVAALEQTAAEQHLDRLLHQLQTFQRRPGERDDLVGEAVDDRRGDRILSGLREHERRQLEYTPLRDQLAVHRLGELLRRAQAEVARDEPLEARLRAAPVLAPGRGEDGGEADVAPAAPVAGDRAERRKPRVAPVRRDADAVDARTAYDGDAPSLLGARAQDGEGVVLDERPRGPAAGVDQLLQMLLLRREVDAGEQDRGDLGHRQLGVRQARVRDRALEELLEQGEAAVHADVVRRAERAADERKEFAVAAEQRDVCLRVAAVDRKDDPLRHDAALAAANRGRCSTPASSSRSASSSASRC